MTAAAASPDLLAPWKGPYGGVPRFEGIDAERLRAGLFEGMRLMREELASIASRSEPATFGNTLLPLEDLGRPLSRAMAVFGIYRSTMASAEVQKLEAELAPLLAALGDEVTQNAALFARISAVYQARHSAGLDAESVRLAEVVYERFARQGAALPQAGKARLAEINMRLATLYTQFSQNVLADEEGQMLVLEHEADLDGLPESVVAGARDAAAAKGLAGKWVIGNTRSAMEPFLTFSRRRALRERGWRMWVSRGEHPGEHDNRPLITEILQLRKEKSSLLGYQSHAHWMISDNMAKTPEAAMALLKSVWPAAVTKVREDVAEMQRLAQADEQGLHLEPWDYRYYAERLRQEKYALDQNEIKAYLQLDQICAAMMWSAEQLFELRFTKVTDVPVVHPDVSVYQVTRDGAHLGLFYFDPYARDGKISGAWMSEYQSQESLAGPVPPIVSNNSNFVKSEGAVLISWDDAATMFHELGHALHGLLSHVRYRTLAGTNVKRDFVELPSQLNEHWLRTPELLLRFARHHQTGEPMPRELVDKIERARHSGEAFRTTEYLAAAIYDLALHSAPGEVDPIAFEAELMRELGMPSQVVMRHRPTQFAHIFSNDDYSAGYYVYLWAEALTADAAEAFQEAGSYYDVATARRLREHVLSVGNTVDPAAAYRAFRGRDADPQALMRDRGFAPPRARPA